VANKICQTLPYNDQLAFSVARQEFAGSNRPHAVSQAAGDVQH
jgi:hypothetical protein